MVSPQLETVPREPVIALERRRGSADSGERVRSWNRGIRAAAYFVPGILIGVNLSGLPYYTLSAAERVRSPLHPWLKPSGYIGQLAGTLALCGFLFLWLYPLRKRYRALARTGSIARWLDVHIVVGLSLPLLAAIHASWRFDGVIGLGFWAMMVVWLSGLVGRYLYVRIPRSRAGLELTIDEIGAEREALLGTIASGTGLDRQTVESILARGIRPLRSLGPFAILVRLVCDDFDRFRAARALRSRSLAAGPRRRAIDRRALSRALKLAGRELRLTQQVRMLEGTHRIFRYWHIAHLPFALTALAAVTLHVVVVVLLGVTWYW